MRCEHKLHFKIFFLFFEQGNFQKTAAIFAAVDKKAGLPKVLTFTSARTMYTEKIRCRFLFQMGFGSGTSQQDNKKQNNLDMTITTYLLIIMYHLPP